MQDPVVIVAAKRTAIGVLGGSLNSISASNLGAQVIKAVAADAKLGASDVHDVIMGQVLTAGCGQNPARQAAIYAGLDQSTTAITINQVCGSGLRAVAFGMQSILCGDAGVVIAGGQENMSQSLHALYMRDGVKFGNVEMKDTMIVDGLWDQFNDYHMGTTAENIAERFSISREMQDEFAAQSQARAQEAIAAGKFVNETVSVEIMIKKDKVQFVQDEFPRAGVTSEGLSKLRPAFKKDGTVTAGNASGLNDGAAAVVLMRESEAGKRGLNILARIQSWATAGVDPAVMGTGPVPATESALKKAGWKVGDLDLVESNEAFAAQACCVMKLAGFDPQKTNVNGGAIALGHPIGASGARILVTLLHEMQRRNAKKALATLCIGGGMGVALTLARD